MVVKLPNLRRDLGIQAHKVNRLPSNFNLNGLLNDTVE